MMFNSYLYFETNPEFQFCFLHDDDQHFLQFGHFFHCVRRVGNSKQLKRGENR